MAAVPLITGWMTTQTGLKLEINAFTLILAIPGFLGFYIILVKEIRPLLYSIPAFEITKESVKHGVSKKNAEGDMNYAKIKFKIKNTGDAEAILPLLAWRVIDRKTNEMLYEGNTSEAFRLMSLPAGTHTFYEIVLEPLDERTRIKEGYEVQVIVSSTDAMKKKSFYFSKI